MAIEALKPEIQKMMEKEIIESQKTNNCHIKLDGDTVKVNINDKTTNEEKILTFPKREIKELFEKLYSE